MVLAIALAAFLGPSLSNAMIAIGVSATPIFVRLTRAQVINVKVEDYIEAARAVGNPPWRIALRHVLPNITGGGKAPGSQCRCGGRKLQARHHGQVRP